MRPRKNADQMKETPSSASAYGPPQELDEDTAEARAREVRERPAAVDQRVRGDVIFPRDNDLEERAVGDEEEDTERSAQERDHIELGPGEVPERIGNGHRRDQHSAPDVCREHHLAPAASTVDPDAGVQREDQVRDQCHGQQRAHLCRARVQCEHRGQWQRDQRHLVAEH